MSDSKVVDKMDMSLDDIIHLNRGSGGSGGRRGGEGGRFNRRGGRGDRNGGRQFQRRRSDDYGGGVSGGGVQRRRDDGPAPYSRPRQVPDVWKHDLYQDNGDVTSRPVVPRSYPRDSDRRPTKLVISNLDFGVNDQDVEELFAEFGKLKRFAVHYDKSGRSLGTADVEYEQSSDAVKAMKQYNNVPLDGKPMKIEMEGDQPVRANGSDDRPRSMSSRLGQVNNNDNAPPRRRPQFDGRRNQSRDGGNRSQGQGRRGQGRGGRGRGGRDRDVVPSKEELDAELDNYNAKMETE